MGPVWFLATYVAVVALTPLTLRAWQTWGWGAVVVPAILAGLSDVLLIGAGQEWAGYLNYLFVWGTVHSFGYAWADFRFGSVTGRLVTSVAGLAATGLLVALGPYPIAMVGLDTAGVTNSQPPKVTLIALALFQTGLLLALEGPRRMLARERNWAMTVVGNSRS